MSATSRRFFRFPALRIVPFLLAASATASIGDALPLGPGPKSAVELGIFLDGVVPSLMEAYHVPGAVVIVVKDGGILLAKGYGYADLESHRPVDPASTLFRVASVSKLFTTTAVMQLVEQGKLDAGADVNNYLDFELEDRFDKPITLADLLTHTPGFDDEYLRTTRPLDAEPIALGRFLAEEMPKRVLPPGETISYSNQGLALAGYLVERVSGQSFESYVEDHVLRPLGMERSRFGIPSPAPADMATPYAYDSGRHTPLGFDRLVDAPAGDLITTGAEMARFMVAHLRLGAYEDVRILEPGTAGTMQSRQFTHNPEMDGWCYGFYEGRTHGVRTVEHGGSWRGFGTEMFLVPTHDLGVFISTNLEYSPRFFRIARRQFFDRYFPPAETEPSAPPPGAAERAAALAGSYLPVRRVRNSILRLGDWMSVITVEARGDGIVEVRFPGDDMPPRVLVELEPRLYREVDGDSMAAVRLNGGGDVSHLLFSGGAIEKLPWYRDPSVHAIVLGGSVVLFVITALGWILGLISRMLGGAAQSGIRGWPKFAAWIVCVLQSIFVIGVFRLLTGMDVYALMQEVPTGLKLLLVLPLVSAVLTAVMTHRLFKGFRTDVAAPLSTPHYFVLTVAAVVVVALEWHWNVLGFWF